MAHFASINGEQIVSGSFCFPYFGVWTGVVELAVQSVPATANLTIANLALTCKAYRTGAYGGDRKYLLVGGAGGWSTVVESQTYNDPSGIALSIILRDVASACGERVTLTEDRIIRDKWVRAKAKGQEVLRSLLGSQWYVDTGGVTQCQDRTNVSTITTPFTVENFDPALGKVTIATEDLASWMPGRKFSAPTMPDVRSISDVSFTFGSSGKLRVECLTA